MRFLKRASPPRVETVRVLLEIGGESGGNEEEQKSKGSSPRHPRRWGEEIETYGRPTAGRGRGERTPRIPHRSRVFLRNARVPAIPWFVLLTRWPAHCCPLIYGPINSHRGAQIFLNIRRPGTRRSQSPALTLLSLRFSKPLSSYLPTLVSATWRPCICGPACSLLPRGDPDLSSRSRGSPRWK